MKYKGLSEKLIHKLFQKNEMLKMADICELCGSRSGPYHGELCSNTCPKYRNRKKIYSNQIYKK
jgi:hypothetical protein